MIHILGAGNIGCLFALTLAQKHQVRLLLRPSTLKLYELSHQMIRMSIPGMGGPSWERQISATCLSGLTRPIDKLIVAVKSHDVVTALNGARDFVGPDTEVLVLHNGMGVREEIESEWPESRPKMSYGVTNAGVKRIGPVWSFEYTGRGICKVSAPTAEALESELLDMLMKSPELVVTEKLPWEQFEYQQRLKLTVNSVINPLTALMECTNGDLLELDPQNSTIYKVVNETSQILGIDRQNALDMVLDTIERTSTNASSMLRDVENGRRSEIDYINGYIVKEAHKQGKPAITNAMLTSLVQMRVKQNRRTLAGLAPLQS